MGIKLHVIVDTALPHGRTPACCHAIEIAPSNKALLRAALRPDATRRDATRRDSRRPYVTSVEPWYFLQYRHYQ